MVDIKNSKGSLLFETLIALLILAVGVTASIRLFGQALYASGRNSDQLRARRFLDNRLFPVFAGVDSAMNEENSGEENIPSEANEKPLSYEWSIEPLHGTAQAKAGGNIVGKKEYGRLKLSIAGESDNRIFDAETVVMQVKGLS